MELAHLKLHQRDKELFDACTSCLHKGLKAKANIYANEIAEIRKIKSTLENAQLAVEKAILRLETLKTISPTFEDLKGVFGDVKGALNIIGEIMPSVIPEVGNLTNEINQLIDNTQFNLEAPEPLVIKDEGTEAILQEAAGLVESELQKKIPVPPTEPEIRQRAEPAKKPMIALAADGSEVFFVEDGSVMDSNRDSPPISQELPSSLSEDLVMDYIERNRGNMSVTRCAKELNMTPAKVLEAVDSLNKTGKIKIER